MAKKKYKYIIIGGGMTGDAATKGIRDFDEEGGIALFSTETDSPYARPPLTKDLWKGDENLKEINLETEDREVDMFLGTKIMDGNPEKKILADGKGNQYKYEKLLLATGGTPKKLPNTTDDEIIYYRTLENYRDVKEIADKKEKVAVIGGGFIGSEIAAGLKIYNSELDITMIFPELGIGGLIFPKELSRHLTKTYEEQGVKVEAGKKIKSVTKTQDNHEILLNDGTKMVVDAVIAGIGIKPNVELAKKMGIVVSDGIVVDEYLRTNKKDVYAAGDVIRFYNPVMDQKIRVEHEDNALWTGEVAGDNMAGEDYKYEHLPMFYSDLFDYGYEAVGTLDAGLDTFIDWIDPFESGTVYYLKDGNVKGVLLWNVWERVEDARDIIEKEGPFNENDLRGLIEE